MNTLNATVAKVYEPYWWEEYGLWCVKIEYYCWGGISSTENGSATAMKRMH